MYAKANAACSLTAAARRVEPLMPLAMVTPGTRVTINEIGGCKKVRAQLFAMGIRRGEGAELMTSQKGDRLILKLGEVRVALGRGIAQRIMVSVSRVVSDITGESTYGKHMQK
jgi:Fe2+ transport system protein FeoA